MLGEVLFGGRGADGGRHGELEVDGMGSGSHSKNVSFMVFIRTTSQARLMPMGEGDMHRDQRAGKGLSDSTRPSGWGTW